MKKVFIKVFLFIKDFLYKREKKKHGHYFK